MGTNEVPSHVDRVLLSLLSTVRVLTPIKPFYMCKKTNKRCQLVLSTVRVQGASTQNACHAQLQGAHALIKHLICNITRAETNILLFA